MSLDDLIKEAARESAMRRKVYPNSAGRPEMKAKQMAAMDAIEQILRALREMPEARAELARRGIIEPEQPSLL